MENETDDLGPFQIDFSDLVTEWGNQPRFMRAAGRREADTRHAHAQAKARLAVVAASLKLAMRKNPGKFDLRDKPTVDEIDSALELQREYQKAVNEVNTTKRDLDYASADTTAYVDRRKALENRVELLALEYHSEKDEPRATTTVSRDKLDDMRRRAVRESE